MLDIFSEIGTALVSALVKIRAGSIIATMVFIQLAVTLGDHSRSADEPLKTFFTVVAIVLGAGGVCAMLMFFYDQFRARLSQRTLGSHHGIDEDRNI